MLLVILVLLLVASAAVGLAVAALLRRRGVPQRTALLSGLGAGAAGGFAVFVYGFAEFAYSIDDTGNDVHDFSPYVEYHELGGWAEAGLMAGYAAIPVVLVAAGMLAGAHRARPLGIVLCVIGGLCAFLPVIVPERLDKYEVGSTEVLHTFRSANVRGDDVRTCMNYGIPRDGNPQRGLCIDLARTPRSEELLDSGDSGELDTSDVTAVLNDRRVTPRDDPGDLSQLGLEVRRHTWYDEPAPLP